jgi:hypothetical protein
MSTSLQFRRGNTSAATAVIGLQGELYVNTDTNTLAVHDGTNAGGHGVMPNQSSLGITYNTTSNVLTLSGTVSSLLHLATNSGAAGLQVGLYTPATSSATGTAGMISVDASYIYVCTATNTWKRAALSTF